MKAVVFHGKEDVRVEDVTEPKIEEPTDAVIRVTASGICGSDLHLYKRLFPGIKQGDILGHEPIGVVEEVGAEVSHLSPGDRVVVPFNVACGTCFYCARGLQSQCETTQNTSVGKGASLFGYTHLYGGIPGGQAEYLRVPQAHYGPIKVAHGIPDDRLFLLADVLPTAWQGVVYADVPPGGTVAVWGLGPIGQMVARIALRRGAGRVFGVDDVPERLTMAARHGIETLDFSDGGEPEDRITEMTQGRGVDAGIDCVGMEASGSTIDRLLQTAKLQPDRLKGLHGCMSAVRRGGTLSIVGVYGGPMQMFPLGDLFDKQIAIKMGQANVRRWSDDIVPLVMAPSDPLGTSDLVTHRVPLADAPKAYERFQKKEDGAIKIVLEP